MKKVTIIIMIMLSLFVFTNFTFAGSNHQGTEFSFGGFSDVAPGACDPAYDFNWGSVSIFNRHDINNNWNINLHGTLGYLWWSSNNNESDQDTFSIGAELILYRKVYKNLSLGLGGGFATLSDRNDLPDLGNSGLYGTITGRLNLKVNEYYGVEFAADHISDTLQDGNDGDGGKNVLALKVYYMFN